MKGTISVVVTCYDLGRTIEEAIESVHRQSRPAAELVVVDDGSTNLQTRQVLTRLARRGVRIIRTENRGVGAARNLGARLTIGDYLVFLDADDVFEPTYFDKAATRLDDDPDLGFVTSAVRAFEGASFVWRPSPLTWVEAVSTAGVPHISSMTRRRLWDAVGGYDESIRYSEELYCWTAVLEAGFNGAILAEPLLRYRVRAGSLFHQAIEREAYLDRMRKFYAKHRAAVDRHGLDLIVGREAFVLTLREHQGSLVATKAKLEAELEALERELGDIGAELDDLRTIENDRNGAHLVAAESDTRAVAAGLETDDVPLHVEVTSIERASVLVYHRIACLDPDRHNLCVSPADFRTHMEHVRRHYQPVSLEALARAVVTGQIPPRAVAVTLDDGYLDALTTASPILLELGIPATFFVNSADLDDGAEALWNLIERVTHTDHRLPQVLELDIRGERLRRPMARLAERESAARWLGELTFPLSACERAEVGRQIAKWTGLDLAPRPTHRRLRAAELVQLAERPGHTIGGHTAHHLALPFHDREVQRTEIEEDRESLARMLGRPVETFAYPYGEFTAATVEIVRAARFSAAVTCRQTSALAGSDPLLLPRFEVTAATGAALPL